MSLEDRLKAFSAAVSLELKKRKTITWQAWAPGTYNVACPPGYGLHWWMCGPGGPGGTAAANSLQGGGGGAGGSVIWGYYSAGFMSEIRTAYEQRYPGFLANGVPPLSIYIPPARSPGGSQLIQTIQIATNYTALGTIRAAPGGTATAGATASANVAAMLLGGNSVPGGVSATPAQAAEKFRPGAGAPGGSGGGRSASQWFGGTSGGAGFSASFSTVLPTPSGGTPYEGFAEGAAGTAGDAMGTSWGSPWNTSKYPSTFGGGGGASSVSGTGGKGGDGGPGCGGGGGGAGVVGGAGGKGGPGIVILRMEWEG